MPFSWGSLWGSGNAEVYSRKIVDWLKVLEWLEQLRTLLTDFDVSGSRELKQCSTFSLEMTYQFHPGDNWVLKDKVVIVTGGALGVGASVVRLAHSAGAHVFFGDVLDEPGTALEKELSLGSKTTIKFVRCDVTSYEQNLRLFDTAIQSCGRIDHAVANAGLGEQGNMFDPELTLETVREEPKQSLRTVDVNLKGVLYFARLAAVYLRQPSPDDNEGSADKSLTLLSSVAGFREDPGLNVYTPTKHGVIGLMRALREYACINSRADRDMLLTSMPTERSSSLLGTSGLMRYRLG